MMRRRFPAVKQHDASDCGSACLCAVLRFHGGRVPISRIRQLASTDAKGTSTLGLVEAAEALGFVAKGVRGGPDHLGAAPLPAIAHVVRDRVQHYVVLYAVHARSVTVMDPATGSVGKMSIDDFRREWSGVLVILAPGEHGALRTEERSVLRRFWGLVSPHRTVLAQAFAGAAVYTLLGLSTSIYVQKILDDVLPDGNRRLLNVMGVIMLALLAAQLFVGAFKSMLTIRTGQRIDAALILGYYEHLLHLPQRFFDTMRVGELTSRVNDAVKIRTFINDVALDLVVNALIVVSSIGLLLVYSPRLALLTLGMVPLLAVVFVVANRGNRRNSRALMERASDLQAHLVESLTSVTTIKRFGAEWQASLGAETRFVRLLRAVYSGSLMSIGAGTAAQLITRFATILLLWTGASLVVGNALTPGELMSSYALLGYLTGPVMSLIVANRTVQEALIAGDRLFEILDLEREPTAPGVVISGDRLGDIELDDVTFRYGTRAPVFDRLSLRIPRGRVTAIVGESGSGKTTIAAILQRLYPVNAGHVRIGGYDLEHIDRANLRRVVAAVPQRVDLFAANVIENIALGEIEVDMRRLIDICGALGVTEFVERLPQGFATQLGENGLMLSGGERQRVAIARALYAEPEVLILDEATSSLDSVSEQYVQRAVHALRDAGKTVVVIAHRLSTVRDADKIVVLARGAVAEEGTHDELLRAGGTYHALWSCQAPALAASPAESRSWAIA